MHRCPENEDGTLWRCTSWRHCSTQYLAVHPDQQLRVKLERKKQQREREEKRLADQTQKVHRDVAGVTGCVTETCVGVQVGMKSQHRATPSADWAAFLEQSG